MFARRSARRVVGIISLLAVASSTLAPSLSAATTPVDAAMRFSDADIFRGVLLFSGPVARAIPEIRDHLSLDNFIADADRLAAIEDVHLRIVDAVRSGDPGLIREFGDAMRSGNHIRIQTALAAANARMLKAIVKLPEVHRIQQQMRSDSRAMLRYRDELRAVRGVTGLTPERRAEIATLSLAAATLPQVSNSGEEGTAAVVVVAAAAVVAATVFLIVNWVGGAQIAVVVEVAAAYVAVTESASSGSSVLGDKIVNSIATVLAD